MLNMLDWIRIGEARFSYVLFYQVGSGFVGLSQARLGYARLGYVRLSHVMIGKDTLDEVITGKDWAQ